MKTQVMLMLALSASLNWAQMPSTFDLSGNSASQNNNGGGANANNGSSNAHEPANPRLLGMELPLLDPNSDTATYNGSKIDVGNNALVRARFEKFLQQVPDESKAGNEYRRCINGLLVLTRESGKTKRVVGSETLIKVGRALYNVGTYPADGGQCESLASAIVSSLDVQRSIVKRERRNETIDAEIDKLTKDLNRQENSNSAREASTSARNARLAQSSKGGGSLKAEKRNTVAITAGTKDIAKMEAEARLNDGKNTAGITMAKINYQGLLLTMLMQRRYDHVVIGSRIYRHVFKDGDNKLRLKKDSEAQKFFEDVGGMPPTINTMDSLASTARREVEQSIEAVHGMLAQNKLSEATNHLINAVALGEYMTAVSTFPVESRQRIHEFWVLRKRAFTALNARDYGTLEEVATKMKSLDADFDDSMLMSFCVGRKMESNLHIRNAQLAFKAGDNEKFNQEIKQAGLIWPRNPNLEKGMDEIVKLDNNEPIKDEFRQLLRSERYRDIYNQRDRFKVVAIDVDLEKDYTDTIMLIGKLDLAISALDEAVKADTVMGPCRAYEAMLELIKEEPRFKNDPSYKDALDLYSRKAITFVNLLEEGGRSEKRGEMGSALSSFQCALKIYPQSTLAKEASDRLVKIIMDASYD